MSVPLHADRLRGAIEPEIGEGLIIVLSRRQAALNPGEGGVVRLIMSGCDGAKMLEFIEEALSGIAPATIKVGMAKYRPPRIMAE